MSISNHRSHKVFELPADADQPAVAIHVQRVSPKWLLRRRVAQFVVHVGHTDPQGRLCPWFEIGPCHGRELLEVVEHAVRLVKLHRTP